MTEPSEVEKAISEVVYLSHFANDEVGAQRVIQRLLDAKDSQIKIMRDTLKGDVKIMQNKDAEIERLKQQLADATNKEGTKT